MMLAKKQLSTAALARTACVLGMAAIAPSTDAAIQYTFTALGGPGVSWDNAAYGIGNGGTIVGQTLDIPNTAAYSNGGLFTRLGPASNDSSGQAVNTNGIAVGFGIFNADTTQTQYAVYFNTGTSPGTMTRMGTGTLGGSISEATAVNGNATTYQAVGYSQYAGGSANRAFQWSSGAAALTPLDPSPTLTGLGGTGGGAFSMAQGINSTGFIVGQATNANSDTHGFLYSPVTGKMYDLETDRHAASGDYSNAAAISNSGIIVGQTDTPAGYQQAFSYTGYNIPAGTAADQSLTGAFTLLGSLDSANPESQALAINSTGVIVGSSSYNGSDDSLAFVYKSSTMLNLNQLATLPSGWVLTEATGINDIGDITGFATYTDPQSDTFTYGFELTPTAVPEPASTASLIAATALAIRRRRTKTD